MKLFKLFIGVSFLVCCILSCEKDDICPESTPTTPRIVIDFKNIISKEDLKTVNNLRIRGINDNEFQAVFTEYNAIDISQVLLPLKSNLPDTVTEVKFQLYKDYEIDDNGTPEDTSDDFEIGNPDVISVTYTINEVYVSAACGFKSQYQNVTITVENDGDNWILLTEPVNDNLIVIDETTTHYNIFH